MDWIAGALELLGNYIIGNKSRWGFVINALCCACWVSYVLYVKSAYGLLLVVVPSFIINVRNFVKWTRENPTEK